jgi:hypothetical protein
VDRGSAAASAGVLNPYVTLHGLPLALIRFAFAASELGSLNAFVLCVISIYSFHTCADSQLRIRAVSSANRCIIYWRQLFVF